MGYWSEFRTGWRPLLGAFLGLGTGLSVTGVVTSIMAPRFTAELEWSQADFAKVGILSIFMSLFIPIAGRLADLWGVRRTAAIGVVVQPLCMVALSRMGGDITQYYIIFFIQACLAVTTTATVFSRVVVANFERARGIALAMAASAPAVAGVFAGWFLSPYVESAGWRNGYLAVGIVGALCGAIALWLLPSRKAEVSARIADHQAQGIAQVSARKRGWADYGAIFRTNAFWILAIAMLLCNLYQTLLQTQVAALIISNGVTALQAGAIISAYSLATVIGRFTCGFAIDRLPGQIVAMVGMGLPCVGLFLMAWAPPTYAVAMLAMIFIGLAYGAEGDLIGVLVARTFGVQIYGSVMGLVTCAISLSTASGAVILSIMLATHTDADPLRYDLFLIVTGVATLLGSLMFLLLPRAAAKPTAHGEAKPAEA